MNTQGSFTALQNLFDTMEFKQPNVIEAAAKIILVSKERYQALVAGTKTPWYFVGIIHYRESTCNFKCHLHNGDPLTARTVQVPKGRPVEGSPPFTWEQSAKDALFNLMKFDFVESWSIPAMLDMFEKYNGIGYRRQSININSPYVWSFTNHYTAGKFVRDGVYDPKAIDKQVGCAPLMRYLTDETLGLVQ